MLTCLVNLYCSIFRSTRHSESQLWASARWAKVSWHACLLVLRIGWAVCLSEEDWDSRMTADVCFGAVLWIWSTVLISLFGLQNDCPAFTDSRSPGSERTPSLLQGRNCCPLWSPLSWLFKFADVQKRNLAVLCLYGLFIYLYSFRFPLFLSLSIPSITEISGMLHTSRPVNTSSARLLLHTAPNCQYKVLHLLLSS